MRELKGMVTFHGSPLTLVGEEIKIKERAPDFVALNSELKEVRLADYKGKVVVVVSVPSLDTPVCDLEVRRFNKEAASLGNDVVILTLSMDLPFAQKRWCGTAGVDRVVTLSDHREGNFGFAFGLLIKELRLLARSVIVIDREGMVRYVELVREMTHEPNYDLALEEIRNLRR